MARKVRTSLLYVVIAPIIFLASLYHYYIQFSNSFFQESPDIHLLPISVVLHANLSVTNSPNGHNSTALVLDHHRKKKDIAVDESSYSTVSVLLPGWEVLVIVSPDDTQGVITSQSGIENSFVCVHYTSEVSPAKLSGILSFPDRVTLRCLLPERARKRLPFKQPVLRKLPDRSPRDFSKSEILFVWSNLVYDTLTDNEDDLIVFAKGLIKKQDIVRKPTEFRCVFGEDVVNGVRTAVKTSTLEVFRCQRPNLTDIYQNRGGIKVSLEIVTEKRVVPSVAYYTPIPRKLAATENKKSLLCACTMVFNVAKFLKEWVYYHSKIGVEKFILYDNGSDDDLGKIVFELNGEGYDVSTYFWLWQKTQESGFSHSALYAKEACKWMMYLDVDEFVYSPKWTNSSTPSISMLQSLVNQDDIDDDDDEQMSNNLLDPTSKPVPQKPVGQISIRCNEFGPSNQTMNPIMGVTQGYNCRMMAHNRHKSIVLLEAVDDSLYNVIHHFELKKEYRINGLSLKKMMVNHYKYQAWPEFKAKFRRRVSAYVVDWNSQNNLNSQDRPKGLGTSSIEPGNWTTSYCQVQDNRLRDLVRKWFVIESSSGDRMPWQR